MREHHKNMNGLDTQYQNLPKRQIHLKSFTENLEIKLGSLSIYKMSS